MTGWFGFFAAFAFFFLTHSLPMQPPIRTRVITALGPRTFTLLYSALSLVALGWLIVVAGHAPYVEIWSWAPWQSCIPLAAMALACLIVALSIGHPNPFSFGGTRSKMFDPEKPGIIGWMRHPLLVALALWSASHIVPNGDLAHIVLFGSFATFAIFGQSMVDRRKRRELGPQWEILNTARLQNRQLLPEGSGRSVALRALVAVTGFFGLLGLHPILFGVNPLSPFAY